MMSVLAADQLDSGIHPANADVPTQFRERGRGIVSFRGDWFEDSTLLLFDGAQRNGSASKHFHASGGRFSISALGEYFAIDSGRYDLDQDQHNVVLIDGKSGHTRGGNWHCHMHSGILTDYQPGAFCDVAAADLTAQSNCDWARRTVGLVKRERDAGDGESAMGPPAYVWCADDINKDTYTEHEYWWTLNTSPENVIRTHRHHASIRGCRQGHWLDVHVFSEQADGAVSYDQDENVTSSTSYVKNARQRAEAMDEPRHMVHGPVFVRPRLVVRSTSVIGRFVALMLPRRRGEKKATVRRISSLPNSVAVPIEQGGTVDTLIYAWDHRILEAADIAGRGNWCLVRRDRESGQVIGAALDDGGRVCIDGESVLGIILHQAAGKSSDGKRRVADCVA